MSIEHLAASHYEKAAVVRWYGSGSELLPPEEKLLAIHRAEIAGRRVLDLGCGGGRTTARLHALAQYYVGVDYSTKMIESCRRRYPAVNFVHGDATNLSMFDAASFDFVLFSYNGLDTMSHDNRLRVLAEVYRVLVPQGLFAFSSHNLDHRDIVTALDRSLSFRPHSLYWQMKYLVSYLLVMTKQLKTDNYAILSDPREGFKQITYYINKQNQIRQLENRGFVNVEVLDAKGELVSATAVDRETRWLYYICRKPLDS